VIILRNPNVHLRVHKSPSLLLNPIEMKHPVSNLKSGLFPSGIITKIVYVYLSHACYIPCYLILLDLIILIIFGGARSIIVD
jgi:hypothetical protein